MSGFRSLAHFKRVVSYVSYLVREDKNRIRGLAAFKNKLLLLLFNSNSNFQLTIYMKTVAFNYANLF